MFATNFEINPDFMLDTLSFSQNMQQAGMAKEIADMLAFNLKNLQINQLENLLTKNEFRIFEKEMHYFQTNMNDFRNETKIFFENFKQETKADSMDFKNEVRADIADFKNEVRTEIRELKTEIAEFKKEIKTEMVEFKNEVRADIAEFKEEINNKIENLVSKKEFYSELNKLNLNLTIRLGTIMVTGMGILGFFLKF